jgi:hypothetical protein
MKKMLLPMLLVLLYSSSAYADKKATPQAMSIINSLDTSDSKRQSYSGHTIARFYYNSKTVAFKKLNRTGVVNKGGFIQVNRLGDYNGQCVSFVKAMANFGDTTNVWRPSTRVGDGYIPVGSVVATFVGNNYKGKPTAHTGIYIGSRDGAMWILDQNWDPHHPTGTVGYMTMHAIKFGARHKTGYGDRGNAYSYYIVK